MSFLNPILLGGLAAVSIPIVIHLLNRRKFRRVTWAAMRFLQNAIEQNQRRLRIEDMILLALRCLLLALLALALARPAILSEAAAGLGQSKVTGVIILDNSRSMGVSDGVATRFAKAKKAAEDVLDAMSAGSATAVYLASDLVQKVIPEPTFDLSLARKAVREAPLSDRGTEIMPALQAALDALRDRLAVRREIFLITDGQAAGWKQLTEIQRALERSKSEIQTHVVLVSEHEEKNLGISDLRVATGLTPVNQPLRVEVRVTNYGREEARATRLSLSIDGQPANDEMSIDSLPAGASKSLALFARLREEGFHAITARVPEDRFPADDQRTVAARAIKEVRVLLADGEPGTEPRESEVFFLRHALVPVPADHAPEYFIKTSTVSGPELAQARLDDFDCVVLANVPDLSDATVTAMENYLRRGGGLIIFPGDRVNATFYNERLLARGLLPAALGPTRGQADQDEKFFALQDKDYDHPIVSLWNDPGSGRLASARFFKAYALQPDRRDSLRTNGLPSLAPAGTAAGGPEAGPARVVLNYADGTPAVVERPWGLGRVVLFSSTADTAWNDLPVRPGFVPLLHRTVGAVVSRQDEGLNIRVGDPFVRRVPIEFLDKDLNIFPPRQTAVREVRRIEIVNGWPTAQADRTDVAGLYDAKVSDPPLALKFAAQADPSESSLDELTAAQLATLKNVANVVTWVPGLSLKSVVEKGRTGLEFWVPILLLCLGLAAVEMFLAQWFSRSR